MDGVRFKTRRINIWNSATIDIEVDDGVKVVDFSKAENTVELRSVKKQFPSVETLIIGKSTSILEISNFMFPNVKEIISEDNQNFKSGNVLIKHDYSGFKLLNTFCKQADEVIDLLLLSGAVLISLNPSFISTLCIWPSSKCFIVFSS